MLWEGRGRCLCRPHLPSLQRSASVLRAPLGLPRCPGCLCPVRRSVSVWKGPGCAGLRPCLLGTPELPSDSPARLFLALPLPNPPLSIHLCADAWTCATLEFVVLICVFLSSLVPIHHVRGARRTGCTCSLLADPKHLPEAVPLPCPPSTSLSFSCQSLGPQFVALNYLSLLQSK